MKITLGAYRDQAAQIQRPALVLECENAKEAETLGGLAGLMLMGGMLPELSPDSGQLKVPIYVPPKKPGG